MTTIYKRKRLASGLSRYTVAREMGFTLTQYIKIEEGWINLNSEWIDKFNDIISRAKEIKFNRRSKLFMIREMIKQGTLEMKLKEQGYNMAELGRAMGYAPSTICGTFKLRKTSDDLIEQVYDFLQNPANKNFKGNKKRKKGQTQDEEIETKNQFDIEGIQEAKLVEPEEPIEEHVETNAEEHVEKETPIETQNGTQTETQTETQPNTINLETKIKMLEREKEILLMQIMRYEKLIDRM